MHGALPVLPLGVSSNVFCGQKCDEPSLGTIFGAKISKSGDLVGVPVLPPTSVQSSVQPGKNGPPPKLSLSG